MAKFDFYKQPDAMDCGPTCLRMIAKHHGRSISLQKLRLLSETTREGSSMRNLADAAELIGFRTLGVKITFEKLLEDAPLPCIAFWDQQHFVVVYKIKKDKVYVADPAQGLLTYSTDEFLRHWIGAKATKKTEEGVALLLDTTPKLKETAADDLSNSIGFGFLKSYVFKHKKYLFQILLGLLAGSLLQLIFPFLTQSIVDIGIQNQDINFIYLILIAQLFLFVGRTAIELIRGWILLHISTRINISLISDFFIKLMNLPIAFFDTKMTGDILQRIGDHRRIEKLMTTSSLSVLFSGFNLILFGVVLAWYSMQIFTVFFIGSTFYFTWVLLFLKRRKDLDYERFAEASVEQSKVIELINGMQDIKLHNAEKQKRWGWEFVQARLYKVSIKSLKLGQWQSTGSSFINELKNIGISILSAKLVIDGDITLGMMMSIAYIVGQLNSPIGQIISFIHSLQDAKIALERLSEIHGRDNEEVDIENKVHEVPPAADIHLENVNFRYTGSTKEVLKKIDLKIPYNKVTAIVGASGSGKTTLMKMLLKFYEPNKGSISVGPIDLKNIAQKAWRNQCGVVMQEGYIFNDTIANNIAIGEDFIDKEKLAKAVEAANIQEFIEDLPLGYNTKLGMEGVGISSGQKQRILIARSVYKNPKILLYDEATSALDAKNERIIMDNLNNFFEDKTVVIIAHRLSTVKNADQIIVLGTGEIMEKGTHTELIEKKGSYFNLVKNQLELESLNDKNKEIDKKIDQVRSDEVQEILGYIPNWTLRWGIGAIFVLILILLSISWIVKYPDYVNGQIIIKTTHPPIKQLANTNGQIIQLKIKDGTTVKKGEIIAEIKSLTSSKSIIWLNQKLEEVSAYLVKEKNKRTNFSPPNSLILGDFQTEYSSLLLSISDLEIERNNGNNQKKIQTLQKQIEHISKLTEINKRKIKWVTLECKNTKVSYENEKRMFKDGLISQTDFFTQEQRFIQGKLRLENFKEVFVNQQISKSSYQTQLDDFIFSNKEKQRKLEEKIQQIVKNISNNISKWKYMNNIEASESGTLTYLMPLHVNKFVSQDNALFAIIPKDKSFKGTMSVSTYGLGKININQQVYVKLDKYPFSQFGLLEGKVEKIYTIPTENRKTGEVENLISISFDQTSSTTYHKNIKLNPENRGTAQIVTSDRRIIERIFGFLGEKNSR